MRKSELSFVKKEDLKIPNEIIRDLGKYKKKTKVLLRTQDGEEIIGKEIDKENRLIYIMKTTDGVVARYAQEVQVIMPEPKIRVKVIEVTEKMKTKKEV